MPGAVAPVHFAIDVVVPRIIELGMAKAPQEACGVVLPDLSVPPDHWVKEMINRSKSPNDSYKIDPATIRGLVEDLKGPHQAWEDVLIWHTHPGGNVGPSKHDWDCRIEGLKYLVVALPRGEATMF